MAKSLKMLILTALALFLWGCSPPESVQPPQVGVQILVQGEKNRALRRYTQPEKLQKVLWKLRTLGFTGLPAPDPETPPRGRLPSPGPPPHRPVRPGEPGGL